MEIKRLGATDVRLAKELFLMMAGVFDEACEELSDTYVETLLAREDFWAVAAFADEQIVGGLTAHALPLTRAQKLEVFIYDIAVRPRFQRMGVGRRLVDHLRGLASQLNIHIVFVLAENEDVHALDFYRALGADATAVTVFTFDAQN